MRKRVCVSVMALSFLVSLAALPAVAKSVNGIKAQVPFDFYVGDRMVPAGPCNISSMTADETVLRISSGRKGAAATTISAHDKLKGEGQARLVFHKYGDQYFLAAVWGADKTGRTLSESKRERNLRKELRAARGGGGGGEMEMVTIDAR